MTPKNYTPLEQCYHGSGYHDKVNYRWYQWYEYFSHEELLGNYKPGFFFNLYRKIKYYSHYFIWNLKRKLISRPHIPL